MQQKIQQFVFLSERLLSEAGELRVRKTWNELSSVSVQLAPYMQQLSQSFDPKYALLFLLSCGNDGTQKNGCFSMLFRKILTRIPNNDFLKLLASINRVELNTYLLPFLYEKEDIGSVAAYTSAKLGLKVKYDSFEFFLSSRDWSQQDLINLGFLVLNDEKEALIQRLGYIYNSNSREVYLQFLNVLQASNIIEPVIPEINENIEIQQVQQSPTPQRSNKKPINQNKFQLPQSNANYKYKLTSNKTPSTDSNANSFAGVSPIHAAVSSSVDNNAINNEVPVINQNISNNENVTQNINSAPIVENRQASSQTIPNNNLNNSLSVQQKEDAPIRYVAEKEDSTTKEEVNKNNTSKSAFNKSIKTNNSNKGNTSSNNGSVADKFNDILSNLKERFSSLESSAQTGIFKNKPVLISIVIVLILFLYLITKLFGAEDQSQVAIKPPPKVDKVPEYWINAVTNKKITPQYIRADVDYRMGELYLSRSLYNEAITFFQSAIKTDSSHNVARLRWGYAELQQGNYFVSEKLLKETLKYEPKMQNANLYLARNYLGEKKYPEASKYYKIEYKNYNNLDVGMEYANFLAKIEKQDEAMDFLSVLQESHPDKMLILDSINNKEKEDNKKQKGQK